MKVIRRLFRFIWSLVKAFLFWQLALRLVRRYIKFPVPTFMGRILDSDWRRFLQPPGLIIERSGIKPGMKVLEIGPGGGSYTIHVARAVGEKGKLFALDIQAEMLAQLQAKLDRTENRDIQNVELLHKSAYDLPFEFGSIDLVYMITSFQEIPDKARTLDEVKRVLKPGGFLAISEFLPDPDYPWMSTTAKMGLKAGFQIDSMEGSLWNYTVRFKKSVSS
jgi:ubiquinone/menaquinone biosynthesis C-methylase UbiE